MTAEGRLGEVGERWGLDAAAIASLAAVLEALESDPHAPTTVHAPREAVDVHVADSLAALELQPVRAARVVADLGSGAGFPGFALAAALPDARVILVESARRKCEFLRRTAQAAGLATVEVVHARAEGWHDGLGACDLVTARALAALPVLAEYAAPLLAPGGALVAWKGRRDQAEEADGAAAAAELGLEAVEVRPVQPWPAARDRHLHVLRKVGPTPERYPRRAGMAAKRPLRAR
ncbi:MAG: rRNA (guanine527-N7)-methyltransferase [Solirubrobacteraceae bacterium]|jgi:16S rRNA (guanine527-N7)-methyltransferase|nr:rRNA (guanine527-N7)-methyltransferase [Solirubrobacteraceae bacterium]